MLSAPPELTFRCPVSMTHPLDRGDQERLRRIARRTRSCCIEWRAFKIADNWQVQQNKKGQIVHNFWPTEGETADITQYAQASVVCHLSS